MGRAKAAMVTHPRSAPALSHAPRPSEARAPSGMAPKVPVVVRVELGKKHHQSGRMHEAEVALSLVVSDALERAEPEIAAGKLTASTVKCFRTTEFSGTGTVLDNSRHSARHVWLQHQSAGDRRGFPCSPRHAISHLLDKPADPTILSHRTVEPNLTARKLTSLATHAIPIPDKRGLTHRSRRPRGDIAT